MRTALHRVAPLLEAGVVLALAHVGAARAAVPGLGVFTGPLGLVLLAAAGLMALGRVRPLYLPVPPPWALFALSALVASAVGIHYVRAVEPSGDEIDYLLMAQSLWREHDLDLRDNFERGDHHEYLGGLDRMPGGARRKDGRSYPTHSAGLPALVAPAYALGGRAGCAVFLALVASALGLLVRDLALRGGADERSSLVAWAAAVGPPVLFYTAFLYTEVVVALCIALALRFLLGSPGPRSAVAAALSLSALPWLHVRMTLAAAALGAFALARLRGRPRLAFVLTAGAMAVAYAGYQYTVFGTVSPFARYGGTTPGPMARSTPLRTLFGLFLDGAYGLLPYAPAFLLALAGLPLLFGRGRRDRWAIALAGLGVLAAGPGLAELVGFLAAGPLHHPAPPDPRPRARRAALGRPGPRPRPLALGARRRRLRARLRHVHAAAGHAHGERARRPAAGLRGARRRRLPRALPALRELAGGLDRAALGAAGDRGAGDGGVGGGASRPPAARPPRRLARPRGCALPGPRPAAPALPRRLRGGGPLGAARGRAGVGGDGLYRFVIRSTPPT